MTEAETRAAVEADICAWLRAEAVEYAGAELAEFATHFANAIERHEHRPAIDRMTLGKQGD